MSDYHLRRGAMLQARAYLTLLSARWESGDAKGFTPPGVCLVALNLAIDEMDSGGKLPPSSDAVLKAVRNSVVALSKAQPA